MFSRLLKACAWLFQVVVSAGYKFYLDDCFGRAASLAYTSLFALVPITALTFALFSGFNISETQLERILEQILPPNENVLLANLKEQVFEYLSILGQSVKALGDASLFLLIFTGIALLNTIESALNAVWRVTSNLSLVSKIISFWAVITLGPLLIAVSFYWYARVTALGAEEHLLGQWRIFPLLDVLVPVAAIWAALTLLYYKLPAERVSLKDAALGAFIGALMFECTKRGFAYYVGISATYSKFYGVLVTIPLFLFWLYLTWVVVLYGAEISYQSGAIKILHGLRKYKSELGEAGAVLGLKILYVIGQCFVSGKSAPSESEITLATGSDPVLVRSCLGILSEAGLIGLADDVARTRTLARAPESITVSDVMGAFISSKRSHMLPEEDTQSAGILAFLERFRRVASQKEGGVAIASWTLKDLVSDAD